MIYFFNNYFNLLLKIEHFKFNLIVSTYISSLNCNSKITILYFQTYLIVEKYFVNKDQHWAPLSFVYPYTITTNYPNVFVKIVLLKGYLTSN